MGQLIRGRDVIVYVLKGSDWVPFVCGTNCSIEIRNEIIQRSTIGAGTWLKPIPRRSEWSVTVDGITTIDDLSNYQIFDTFTDAARLAPKTVKVEFTDASGDVQNFSGTAYMTSAKVNGDVNNFSDFNIELIGSGPLTINSAITPTSYNVDTIYQVAAGGETSYVDPVLINRNIVLVWRESYGNLNETAGTPSFKEFKYTAATGTIDFDANSPMGAGEQYGIVYET